MAEKKKAASVFSKEFLDSKRLSSQQLADHLQILWDQLKELANVDDDKPKAEAIAKSLLQPSLLRHESLAGRLHTAACAIDVIRICAPSSPYDDEDIKTLFELFITLFERLSQIVAAEGNAINYILEHLSTTRAAVLISDDEVLRLRLMKTFFDNIRKEHSSNVGIHMLEIMSAIIDEADTLDDDLIQFLLMTLLEGHGKGGNVSQELAGRLIRRTTSKLSGIVSEFLAGTWSSAEGDKELRGQLHRLIFELFWVDSSLVSGILQNLEEELEHEELEVREEPVRMLAAMFSAKESNLAREYPRLFTTFLKRFKDVNVALRQIMIAEFAKPFLTNHSEGQNAVLVNEALGSQIVDGDESCRQSAFKVVMDVGSSAPDALTQQVMVPAISRLLDRKASVRMLAFDGLSKLYASLVKRFSHPQTWGEARDKLFGGIPNALLHAYLQTKRGDMEENVAVEKALATTIFDLSEEPDDGDIAALLFHLTLAESDERARKAIQTLFNDKRKFRDALGSYLKHRSAIDIENPKELDVRTLSNVSAHLPFNNSLEMMKKFHTSADKSLLQGLASILDPHSSKERKQATKENIERAAKGGSRQATFIEAILQRLDTFLTTDHVNALLGLLETRINNAIHSTPSKKGKKRVDHGEKEGSELNALLSFSETLSKALPFLFAECLDLFTKLVPIDNDELTPRILSIAANSAEQFREDVDYTKALLKPLTSHILEGRVSAQVRSGIVCLHNMFAPELTKPIFKRLIENYVKSLSEEDRRLNALKTLKEMAHYSYEHVEAVFSEVFDFVMDELIPMQPIDADTQADEPSELAQSKTAGLSFIRTLLVQMAINIGKKNETFPADLMAKATSFASVLFAILSNEGHTHFTVAGPKEKARGKQAKLYLSSVDNEGSIVVDKDGETSSEIDRETMRARCAIQALKLVNGRPFEKLITPTRFTVLSQITVDTVFEVRSAFLNALEEGIYLKDTDAAMIPVKYLALIIPYAADREDELRTEAKTVLTNAVVARRQFLRSRLAASAKGDAEKEKKLQWSTAPENCVLYAVHTLAALKTYESDAQSGFSETTRSLQLLVDALFTNELDSITFVKSLLGGIPFVESVVDPEIKGIYAVAEIMLALITRLEERKKLTVRPGNLPKADFPPFFRPIQDQKRVKKNMLSQVPLGFDVTKALAKVKETKPKRAPAKPRKRVAKSSEESESSSSEKESEVDAMDIDEPPKPTKKAAPKAAPTASAKASSKPKAVKPSPKKKDVEEEVHEKEESEEHLTKEVEVEKEAEEKEKEEPEEPIVKRPRQKRTTSSGTPKKVSTSDKEIEKEGEEEEGSDKMDVDFEEKANVETKAPPKKKPAPKRKLVVEEADVESKETEPPAKKAKVEVKKPKAKEVNAFPIEDWLEEDLKKTPTKNSNGNKKRAEKEEVRDDAEDAEPQDSVKRPMRKRKGSILEE